MQVMNSKKSSQHYWDLKFYQRLLFFSHCWCYFLFQNFVIHSLWMVVTFLDCVWFFICWIYNIYFNTFVLIPIYKNILQWNDEMKSFFLTYHAVLYNLEKSHVSSIKPFWLCNTWAARINIMSTFKLFSAISWTCATTIPKHFQNPQFFMTISY